MRPTYSFSEAEVEAIASERYRHPDPRVQERMEILWLKYQGETHERLGELANLSRSTVQRTLRIYAAKGLEGIRSFGWKGQPSALTPHRATIEEAFRRHPPHTASDAARQIEELTNGRSPTAFASSQVHEGRLGDEMSQGGADPGAAEEVGRGTRPNAGGLFKRRSLNRGWRKPGKANACCTSWTLRISCWRRSWVGCGALCGCM